MNIKEDKRVEGLAPVYDSNTKILILGSFPSVKSREKGFYYMNPYNRFYKVLDGIFGTDLYNSDIDEKKKILKSLHIGLSDVVASCQIEGSSDSDIKDYVLSDIDEIVNNAQISKILLNGKLAYNLFTKNWKNYLNISYYLPSTSPANAIFTLDILIKFWKEYII